ILVLAVDLCPFMEIYRSGIKIFSFEQWLISILFTVQVAQKCKRVIRITIIQCRISLGTNEDHRKRAITEKNKAQRNQSNIQQQHNPLDRIPNTIYKALDIHQDKYGNPNSKAHNQDIDKE